MSNDVALLLRTRMLADARRLKEDASEACTDSSKCWLNSIPQPCEKLLTGGVISKTRISVGEEGCKDFPIDPDHTGAIQ